MEECSKTFISQGILKIVDKLPEAKRGKERSFLYKL
jgi:hypothetical protein